MLRFTLHIRWLYTYELIHIQNIPFILKVMCKSLSMCEIFFLNIYILVCFLIQFSCSCNILYFIFCFKINMFINFIWWIKTLAEMNWLHFCDLLFSVYSDLAYKTLIFILDSVRDVILKISFNTLISNSTG